MQSTPFRVARSSSIFGLAFVAAVIGAPPAKAGEVAVSVYGGYNSTFDSDMTLRPDSAMPATTYKGIHWDGDSFGPPPYWGVRGVYWFNANSSWGAGIDYSHTKVIAERPPALDALVSHLQFTDGNNLVFATGYYRYQWTDRLTPYVGLGVGVAVPEVEVSLRAVDGFDTTPTHQYELGGPAVQATLGVDAKIWGPVSAFGEYKIAYSSIDVSFRNGGREQTDLLTNQFVLGVSYTFR